MSTRERVAQVYPQAPTSLLFAFYYSQGYGRSILTCLHTKMTIGHHTIKENAIFSYTMKVT
jgi:hypothetical protein